MKLYKIVKKIQEKYPEKYNELSAEPWFKKNQGNLGIWARTRWLGWKMTFNWNWFPDEIKQELRCLCKRSAILKGGSWKTDHWRAQSSSKSRLPR